MLTKRTNILFDEKMWQALVAEARKKQSSVGELVRSAVEETYLSNDQGIVGVRQRSLSNIRKVKQQIKQPISRKEIKQFIEYGRQ